METHKFLGEFIDMYKNYPCLWKYSCKDYRNKSVKDNAYSALLAKLREIDPRADKNSVMRKINALRTSFRREHKKVRKVQLQTTKKYVPSLWYYDLLKFVVEKQDFSEPPPGSAILDWPVPQRATTACVGLDGHSDELKSDSTMDFFEDTESIDLQSNMQIKIEPSSSTASSPIVLTDEICEQVETNIQDEVAATAINSCNNSRLRQESSACPVSEQTAADLDRFGAYVAAKLKRSSRKQSIIAEKVIAEVLMRANLGTLDETTVLTDVKLTSASAPCLP